MTSPLGYVRITNLSSARNLGTIPPRVSLVWVQAETVSVRWRDDGVDPTASSGNLIPANETLSYIGPIEELRFIEVSAGASLNVNYYK